jgi:hypothetical protein
MSEATNLQAAEKPIGYECRFAVYCPPQNGSEDDWHLVKEIAHYAPSPAHPEGRREPRTRLVKNYTYPFYVTKKGGRNHEQKKEWEELTMLDRFESTRSKRDRAIAKALGMGWFQGDPRQLARSPYLYGSDILSTAVLKKTYQQKWPNLMSGYSVACFDTEKDVVYGTEEINMATLSFGKKVFTAVQKSFVEGLSNVQERAHETFKKYLSAIDMKDKKGEPITVDVIEKRGLEWELVIVDREIDVIVECMKKAHEWKPDFVAIWNIDFDMQMMVKACERAGYDPAHIFSDPSVPPAFRHFKYKQGQKQKKTASGKLTPIKPADQWHSVFTPSSFYFIDAMCVYRKIRIAKGEEPSYALDAILDKILGARKLKFKEAEQYTKLEWHQFMQLNFKLEYIVYNVFDCVSMEMLDETTLDLQVALPGGSGCSDFSNFKSQPRRTVDDLHYFALDLGLVIGSTSDEMQVDLDKLTLGLENWIVTLPAHLVADNGLKLIEEYPELRTNIRVHVADLDVSASYPNGEVVFNIGKCTTKKELCRIEGVPEQLQRAQGINLSGGHTNAVEFCVDLYGLPHMEQWLTAFRQSRGIPVVRDALEDADLAKIQAWIARGETLNPVEHLPNQKRLEMTLPGAHRELDADGNWIDLTGVDGEEGTALQLDLA